MSSPTPSAAALPNTRAVLVRLPEATYRRVAHAAAHEDRSMSSYVRRALNNHLEEVGRS
jgi:predicted DNA-binding protein